MREERRLAFVTIGESPRDDLVPDMLAEIGDGISATEFGALDSLSEDEIAGLAPLEGEASFATRRRDGREAIVSKERVEALLARLLDRIDDGSFYAVVLLCTGTNVAPMRKTLLIEAQRLVDSMVEAMSTSSRRLGDIIPLERQAREFASHHSFGSPPRFAAASPYSGDDMAKNAKELADCDLVIMHCMGYTDAMRTQVRGVISAPVLLSRRIVSAAIRQLL